MDSTYENRTQLILTAIFIHYMGYFIILLMDSTDFPKRVSLRYGLRKLCAYLSSREHLVLERKETETDREGPALRNTRGCAAISAAAHPWYHFLHGREK